MTMDEARKKFLSISQNICIALEEMCEVKDVMDAYGDYNSGGTRLDKCYDAVNKAFLTLSAFPFERLGGSDMIEFDSTMKQQEEIKKWKAN